MERFRPLLTRMLGRWHLTVNDVQALRGMLAQMNYFCFGQRFDNNERSQPVTARLEPAPPRADPPEQPGPPAT